MKPLVSGLLLFLCSCKQYVPKETVYSTVGSVATLASSQCKNKNLIYVTQDPSSISWSVGEFKGTPSIQAPIASINPASGQIELSKGLLNQVSGIINFNVLATATGDPIRDRLFQEILFGSSTSSPFRFAIKRLNGTATAVANGGSIDMKAEGNLEIGGRRSPVTMPVKISEKDGVYEFDGSVTIDARQSRPAVNAIDLDDKFKLMESAMGTSMGKTIDLKLNLKFKNNCLPKS